MFKEIVESQQGPPWLINSNNCTCWFTTHSTLFGAIIFVMLETQNVGFNKIYKKLSPRKSSEPLPFKLLNFKL